MAWSPNSSRTPRRKSCGRKSRGAYQVLIQLWKLVPQRTWSGPLSRGVKAQQLAEASDNSDRRRRDTERAKIGAGDAARPLISHVGEEADDPQKDYEQDSTLPREGPVWRI
jgi:hypothetical protein